MSSVSKKQERPIPWMLVLTLLAAAVLSSVLGFAVSFAMSWLPPSRTWQMEFSSLFNNALSFPFGLTCVVWLAARSGRTTRSTWVIPMLILLILSAAWAAAWLPVLIRSRANSLIFAQLFYRQWSLSLRAFVLEFVLLAFAFRFTSLHLRPVDAAASPHRLTVLSILVLTSIVAICLSVEALAFQLMPSNTPFVYKNDSLNLFRILASLFYQFLNALLWFSTAWLFVLRNPMRWIGGLGLAIYLLLMGIYYLLVLPLLLNQQPVPPGARMVTFGPFFFVGSFAVCILHAIIVFLCVGMMHLAGFRWDIRRPLPNGVENGVPPLLSSRLEAN